MSDGGEESVLRTIRAEATFLGISEATLRRWLRQKQIRAFRMGRTVRLDHREVEAFIRARTGA